MSGSGGVFRRAGRLVADIRRDEWPLAVAFAAQFFLVIAAFWILKPLRTSQFLGILGAKNLPWARLTTALLVLPVAAVMAYLSARLPRRRMLLGITVFFGAGHLLFGVADRLLEPAWVHVPFYFWVDIYVTSSVALFWSHLNERTAPGDAKRLYGLIGAGGMLGGIAGSSLSGFLATTLGGANLVFLTAATTAASVPVLLFIDRRFRAAPHAPAAATPEVPPSPAGEAVPGLRAAWDGAAMVLRSRYLIGILGIVTLYEISSVLADFQFSAFVVDAFPGRAMTDSRTEYLGRFAFFTGLLGIAIQIFATSAIQRRVGVGAALLVLPAAMASGAAAFLALPALWTASLWFGADATLNYGIHQSSKEALYTPTPVDAKYRAKAFIDVFGIRLAKAAGALLIWAMVALGSDPRPRAVAAVAIVALWIRLVVVAGRRFDRGGMVGGNCPAGTQEPDQ